MRVLLLCPLGALKKILIKRAMSALKNKRNIRKSANIAGGFCGERFGSQSWLAQKTNGSCIYILPPFVFRARLGCVSNKSRRFHP